MKDLEQMTMHRIWYDSPIGRLCIEEDGEALTALYKVDEEENVCGRYAHDGEIWNADTDCAGVLKDWDVGISNVRDAENSEGGDSELLRRACSELDEYFAGERSTFDLPLHPHGTEFQRKVWDALREIPCGETRSYSDIAKRIGQPKACRAVGGANNKNPILIFIPCHRVVGKNGDLTGFACGLDTKEYLLRMEKESLYQKSAAEIVSEAPFEYIQKRDGGYTLEDYYALPDDQRVELIDGVFYDMGAPLVTHQIAALHIARQLADYIDSQKGNCLPLVCPVDVQLDCDDRTMVQPDVLVVCDRNKVIRRCIYGAPDLVVEVLSDSTARKDQTIKLAKYRNAGVREYWLIDLKKEIVILYDLEHGSGPLISGMDQPVSVRIYDGKCRIHFDEILAEVRPLLL